MRPLASLILLPGVIAWNFDVHQQIGFLAEEILKTAPLPTLPLLGKLLEPEYHGSIGRAAAWADEYKDTPEGKHSYIWHWITPNDKAPDYCNLYYTRDCGAAGCVVSAIEEQSAILSDCLKDLKASEAVHDAPQAIFHNEREFNTTCSHALKWVVHFIGDVAQPLHANGRAYGGNLDKVNYGNQTVRLHQVFDKYVIYDDANVTSFSGEHIDPFFVNLFDRVMNKDDFLTARSTWINCFTAGGGTRARECAMEWARESNQWNCDYIYGRKGWDTEDMRLSGYAVGAYPIVELQVAKAASRLAIWLFSLVHPPQSAISGHFLETSWQGANAKNERQEI